MVWPDQDSCAEDDGPAELVLEMLTRLDIQPVKGPVIGNLSHDDELVVEVLIIITAAAELIMINDSWLPVMAS